MITHKILTEALNSYCNESTGTISILVSSIDTSVSGQHMYAYNTNKQFVIASVIKVLILCSVLEVVKNGKLSLHDQIVINNDSVLMEDLESFPINERYFPTSITIKELMEWMIIVSCNSSTNILIDLIGMDNINDYATKLNLNNTSLNRKMCDIEMQKKGIENFSTMEDMYKLYYLIFNDKILTPELCEFIKQTLYNQRRNHKLLRYISTPVSFAHKTGGLPYVNHDIGVLMVNKKYYFIGVFIENTTTEDGDLRLMGAIGKFIIKHLSNNSR